MKPYALIITGNLEQVSQYQHALNKLGFLVRAVTTGARAQVQLAFTTPDLIVLDLQLPDIPGEVVLRQVNAYQRLAGLPLILLAADQNPAGVEEHPGLVHVTDRAIAPMKLAALAGGMVQTGILV